MAANSQGSEMASRLSFHRSGQGPLLLMLHGIGSSRSAWNKQIAHLEHSYTCIAPDLPGYGDSPDPAGAGLESIVGEIATVLGGEPAHILGVSFGALSTIALARRHPQLVRSMVLADATLGRAQLGKEELARWLQNRRALASDLMVRSRERAAEIASPHASAHVIEEIAKHMRRARPAGYLAVAEAIAATNAEPWLPQIRQPALVICGEDDGVTGLTMSRTLSQQLANARMLTIEAAGHAPHIEQPDAFASAVRGFLAEQPR